MPPILNAAVKSRIINRGRKQSSRAVPATNFDGGAVSRGWGPSGGGPVRPRERGEPGRPENGITQR
jgi:hypothetical protein